MQSYNQKFHKMWKTNPMNSVGLKWNEKLLKTVLIFQWKCN